jgi:hypothetical protein
MSSLNTAWITVSWSICIQHLALRCIRTNGLPMALFPVADKADRKRIGTVSPDSTRRSHLSGAGDSSLTGRKSFQSTKNRKVYIVGNLVRPVMTQYTRGYRWENSEIQQMCGPINLKVARRVKTINIQFLHYPGISKVGKPAFQTGREPPRFLAHPYGASVRKVRR